MNIQIYFLQDIFGLDKSGTTIIINFLQFI